MTRRRRRPRQLSDVAEIRDYSLALEEARRAFDALAEELAGLRNRSTQILSVSGLVAAFLGGLTLDKDRPVGTWGGLDVGAFVVMVCLTMVILWPRRLYASIDPTTLVTWAEIPANSRSVMDRDLALHLGEKYEANRRTIDQLTWVYCGVVATLLVEIISFVLTLWNR